jgi:hypothetical protein
VRGGSEAEEQDPSGGIAKARHGSTPVVLVAERRSLVSRDLFAPLDESWARPAVHDLGSDSCELVLVRHVSIVARAS